MRSFTAPRIHVRRRFDAFRHWRRSNVPTFADPIHYAMLFPVLRECKSLDR
jgi:hypothetical protein